MIVEHLQQQLEYMYVESERKNETRALRKMLAAKRVKKDERMSRVSRRITGLG